MTKQEMNDAVAAYLDQHNESYEDVINGLSKVIKNYYDELERKKEVEKKRRTIEISNTRVKLTESILNYLEIILGEKIEDKEYDKIWRMLHKALKEEVEPTIDNFKKACDLNKSDEEILLNYVKKMI